MSIEEHRDDREVGKLLPVAQRYIVGGRVPAKGISGAVAEKVFSATMPTRKPSWIRRAERVDEVYA